MKRQTPFKLAAHNTLKITQRQATTDKLLLNTLQAGNNLHKQLAKSFGNHHPITTIKTTDISNQHFGRLRNQQQMLIQEVAALDNFKVGVTRQKTRELIEKISLRRRQKHLEALSAFKQDLDDYKQNLELVYNSIESDLKQVLSIREIQLKEYLSSISPEYLISRQKQMLVEMGNEVGEYGNAIESKLAQAKDQLQRLNKERKGLVDNKLQYLLYQLLEIAFVLEEEAKQIIEKERRELLALEAKKYEHTKQAIARIELLNQQLRKDLEKDAQAIKMKWKQLNEDHQISNYIQQSDLPDYQWPNIRQQHYQELIKLQQENSSRKYRLISNLAKEHPDCITKPNMEKWNEQLKLINHAFNQQFDIIMKELMLQLQQSESHNTKLLQNLRRRLVYIQNHLPEEVNQLIEQKCIQSYHRNIKQPKQLLKNATNYIESSDERQNLCFEKLVVFLGEVGSRNDDFSKRWAADSQEYKLAKAKILDEDDELVQKLNSELKTLKQQLRQSLHHIKLQELQKAAFQKIDDLEKAYRKTHQNNKELVAKRPQAIDKFMNEFEARVAEAFSLFDQSKKAQLLQKAKKQCQEMATKRYQDQQKKKAEEELLAAEEIKKKGGKAAPAKPKDPKKAQAEMQERKKVLMQEIGLRNIEQVKTGSESVWLAFKSLLQISRQFYRGGSFEGEDLGQELKNYRGQSLVTKNAIVTSQQLSIQLDTIRNNFFLRLSDKKKRVMQQAEQADSAYLEVSLTTLDSRLRQHYPLKGKLQAEIGIVRSGQIASHKKQYEKQVRSVKQKMDLQTQKFNFLLQRCLELIKGHNVEQKGVKQQLGKGKTLSDFQGCHRKAHDNFKMFIRQTQQIAKELLRLSTVEVEAILHHNSDFLKRSKSIKEGGEFSQSQIDWYQDMMVQINSQITLQKEKRTQKTKEVQEHIDRRSKQLIQLFTKDYNNVLEDLAARQGTGKRYGRPKRIAQEKIRLEMNKCEQAQINIDQQLQNLAETCQQHSTLSPQKPPLTLYRQQLITLHSCIARYAKHIEALVNPCKARVMPRITRLESSSDALVAAEEEEQDKKRMSEELLALGPLGEQKEDKIFLKFLEDIEKLISEEARAIYVADKAKYITGNDKIPDFLRLYIQNMKKNAQQFRQECVRNLRQSCSKLSALTNLIIDLIFSAIKNYFHHLQHQNFDSHRTQLNILIKQQEREREQNLFKLRPNLSNPKCQQQLKGLDQRQAGRQSSFIQKLSLLRKSFEDKHFLNATTFLICLLNNYQFLILYFDSIYLPEDFVKVSGDQISEKKHLDAKQLLLIRQKALTIEANSERNIRKKWQPLNCSIFNFGDRKFMLAVKPQQQPKDKDKKGAKKDNKAAKVQEIAVNADQSKIIQTFKTWRQKSVFTNRQVAIEHYKQQFDGKLQVMGKVFQGKIKDNQSFKVKWQTIAKQLYVA